MCSISSCAKIGCISQYLCEDLLRTLEPTVAQLRKDSINEARTEELIKSKEKGDDGISIMTDARHSCRKNSYHTDHLAVGQLSHKIVDARHHEEERSLFSKA